MVLSTPTVATMTRTPRLILIHHRLRDSTRHASHISDVA